MRNEKLIEILVAYGGSAEQTEPRNDVLNKILVAMGGTAINGKRNEILEAIANV